jgi:hypothetical protein
MGGTGLLADEVNEDAQKIKKWSRCKGRLGAHHIYNQLNHSIILITNYNTYNIKEFAS